MTSCKQLCLVSSYLIINGKRHDDQAQLIPDKAKRCLLTRQIFPPPLSLVTLLIHQYCFPYVDLKYQTQSKASRNP